ncbi:hypothetical protein [Streptomyces sp. NPDC006610]|jgi:hypothetical protein
MSRRTRPCRACGVPVRQPRIRIRRSRYKYCKDHREGWFSAITDLLGDL